MGGAEAAPARPGASTTSGPRPHVRYAPSTRSTLADKLAGTAVAHPAAVPGARGRAGRDRRPDQPATASSPATPTTTATSTASSASSAASAWSSSGTPRSSARSADCPARHRSRRGLARAAGADPDLVSHRRSDTATPEPADRTAGLLGRDPAAGHRAAGRAHPDEQREAVPRAQGHDAAAGGLRRGRQRSDSAPVPGRPSRTSPSGWLQPTGRQSARGLPHAPARGARPIHYERDPDDPRIRHALTLAVDRFGNVLRSATVGYGRRRQDPALPECGPGIAGRTAACTCVATVRSPTPST